MIFTRAPNPIWFLVDLEGLPLNDEYWAIFLTNTLPYIPQAPSHDPEGLIPWNGGKVQFQPGGTLPNELYFNPDLVYRIEIRHGPNQTDPLIYEINNFVPCCGSNDTQQNDLLSGENQITNPQFQDVSFVTPYTYTQSSPGDYTIEVAPGWFLDLTGQGTTILSQIELSGTDDVPGNPPYALRLNNSGWSTAILRQRFNQNGAIFASGAIAMDATVRALDTTKDLIFTYNPSFPGTPIEIFSGTAQVGIFSVLKGAINLPASSNNNTGDNAYVDIEIEIEPTGTLDITNIQVLGQSVPLPNDFVLDDTPLFKEQTIERQFDQQFHYYAPSILILPKKSLAVGWNFRNNPWQFNPGTAMTISTTPLYTADQTIVVTSAANSIEVSRAAVPYGMFEIAARSGVAQGSIAVFQYIDAASFLPYWGYRFSVLVRARINTTNSTEVKLKVRAFTSNGLPNTLSPTDPISSWDANGDPVFQADYFDIAPENDPAYTLQNNYDSSLLTQPACPAMAFNNINITPIISSSAQVTCGVMVYTVGELNSVTPDSIFIEEITFVPNIFAMDNIALTFDEHLHACQYYYEKSYNLGDQPGATTSISEVATQVTGADTSVVGLITQYKSIKRTNANPLWYSPDTGTVNRLFDGVTDVTVTGTSNSSAVSTGYPNLAGALAPGDTVFAHWTADARLGL